MGPPSYMWSIVDRNVVTWCIPVFQRAEFFYLYGSRGYIEGTGKLDTQLRWEVQAEFQTVRWGENTERKNVVKHPDNIPGVTHFKIKTARRASRQMDMITFSKGPILSPSLPKSSEWPRSPASLPQEVKHPRLKTNHPPTTSSRDKYEWSRT
jgi:hypothetical protein